ncbi:MAG: nitroreductase [Candidatus Omnitrophota bacterium]|nr:MAG: nitroreductase [Candidatus Omnitrophota bacterium]
MDVLKAIKLRRSIRRFKKGGVSKDIVKRILEAGRWAPSGLNNQPWRFMVLEGDNKDGLSRYTHYSSIIKGADKVILVFLDKKDSYNYEKDLMAIGSCVQNMLLYVHSQKLGACWLGEILNKRKEISKFLRLSSNLELEAVVALGKPLKGKDKGARKSLKSLVVRV